MSLLVGLMWNTIVYSETPSQSDKYQQLQQAYPQFIQSVNDKEMIWKDGTRMLMNAKSKTLIEKLTSPTLADQIDQWDYPMGPVSHPNTDPGRIRYEPFFQKMYGDSPQAVEKKLVTIYWMPKIFGKRYPLQVTTVNSVNKKFLKVSQALEELVIAYPKFLPYLENPGGLSNWRYVANSNRLSPHSYGIAFDINPKFGNYWQWDLQKHNRRISESSTLHYQNEIPQEIVTIFEKNGFIWGGKWYHYDTMHFEYRPELIQAN